MLQELKGFEEFVNRMLQEWNVPGASIAIVRDGETILSQGFGVKDIGRKSPVTPKTVFAIGSCTKAITATCLGILVDEGKLVWDKPVKEYIPDFRMYDPYVTENMTPRDLVTHRSGLPRHDLVWYDSSLTRKELFDRLRYLEPSRGFRSVYQYQNLMYMAAGYLIGQVTGGMWEQFVQERILDPLGMVDTNFSVAKSQEGSDYALPYVKKDDAAMEVPFRNIDAMGPAGSINSSVTDMAEWILLNLNDGKRGEKQVIPEGSLSQPHFPQIVIPEPIKYNEISYCNYGMGWGIETYRGHLILQHGGGIDGFSAIVSLMPKQKIGVVILTNMGGNPVPTIITYKVYDRLLGLDEIPWNQRTKDEIEKARKEAEKTKSEAAKERKTGTRRSHPLEDYAGDYEHPAYGIISIEVENDHLNLTYRKTASFPLKRYHYDTFEGVYDIFQGGMKFTFMTNKSGNVSSLSAPLEASVSDIVFVRVQKCD